MKGIKAILIALFVMLLSSYAIAFPPSPAGGKVLDLSGGKQGYYYAEDTNNSFDDEFLKKGFTIEFWFCPARPVKKAEAWNLIAKFPFYHIEVVYFGTPESEWMCLRKSTPGGSGTRGFYDLSKAKDYVPEWHYYIFQGSIYGNCCFNGIAFFDGVSEGNFGSSSFPDFAIDSDYPLYIGGLPPGSKTDVRVDAKYIVTDSITFDGLIDEIRISNIKRYDWKASNEKIDIPKRFEPDANTVALWHFDEGKFLKYEDASGNGHTLFASKELGITPKRSIPALWGEIKR